MTPKYSLNDATVRFLMDFEQNVPTGEVHANEELVQYFKQSVFHREQFDSYYPTAISKAIWWAVTRSDSWALIKRGLYKKIHSLSDVRRDYIRYLSQNLFEVIQWKAKISDDTLRKYHLSSKALGDDLYFLTEGYFRKNELDHRKHSMSDFVTVEANAVLESHDTRNQLIYEHMVPKNLYLGKIVQSVEDGTFNEDMLYNYLNKYYYLCTVTKDEDKRLPSISIDDSWNMENPFHRYEKANIRFIRNPWNRLTTLTTPTQ